MIVNTKSNPHTGRSSLDQNQLEKIWKAKVENKCKLVSSTARQITYCGSHHLSRWSGQSSLFVSCVPSQWESGTRLLYAQQYNFQMVQQSMVRHTTFTTWWQFFTTKAYNTSPGGDTQHGICVFDSKVMSPYQLVAAIKTDISNYRVAHKTNGAHSIL